MKNRIIHLVALTLTLCMVLGLVSCNNQSSDEEEVNEDVYDTLISNGNSEHSYAIVRSEGASEEEAELVSALSKKIYDATGYAIGVNTDFEREGTQFVRGDYEILVGVTNRDESQELSSLPYRDWAITYETTRVAIYAKTIDSLSDAIDYFVETYLDAEEKTLKLPKGLNYSKAYEYDIKTLTINGNSIDDYQIVATDKDKLIASSLAHAIGMMSGTLVPIEMNVSTDKKNIIIGTATSDSATVLREIAFNEYLIQSCENGDLIIGSNNLAYDSEYAVSVLLKELMSYDIDKQSFVGAGNSIEISSVNKKGEIMDDKLGGLINADAEYLAGIDKKANELKSKVLLSGNTINPSTFNGTVYYVSPNGNDANSGKSPSEAWKTLEHVNFANISSGSAVLFERGGIWRGSLKTRTGVTYSSYGEGDKPCIYGSPESGVGSEKWSLLEGTTNIWVYYKDMNDVGEIVFNDGESWGVRVYFSFNIDTKEYYVYNSTTDKLDVKTALNENLKFFSAANSKYSTTTEDRGDGMAYYKEGVPNVGSYECTGKLYLRCDEGNPGEVFESIEFCTLSYTASGQTYGHIVAPTNNVVIDNLCFKYGGTHGIGGGDCDGLKVTNCEIGWIGGNVHAWVTFNNQETIYKTVALGNGIEVARNCTNFIVKNNWIYHTYDEAITNQSSYAENRKVENIEYVNNLIEKVGIGITSWLTGKVGEETPKIKNLLIEGNIIRFIGYNCHFQSRPNKGTTACFCNTWGGYSLPNRYENVVIRNNIFDRTHEALQLIVVICGKEEWLPVFEENTYIQYYNGKFGLYEYKSKEDLKLQWAPEFSKATFDFAIADYIRNVVKDKNAEIAIVVQ